MFEPSITHCGDSPVLGVHLHVLRECYLCLFWDFFYKGICSIPLSYTWPYCIVSLLYQLGEAALNLIFALSLSSNIVMLTSYYVLEIVTIC